MKKLLSIVFYLFLVVQLNAQFELFPSQKGEWIATNYLGFATLEAENTYKTNAFVLGGFLGKEFRISKRNYIVSGIEHLRLKSDIYVLGETAYLSHNFLQVPVKFRTAIQVERATFYAEIGLYASYLYHSRTEIVTQDFNVKETGLGFNFGTTVGFGMKYILTDRYSVSLGFNSQSDLFQSYKNKPEISLSELYMLQFGLGLRI